MEEITEEESAERYHVTPDELAKIDLSRLAGDLPVRLVNDYLFRTMLQANNQVLKSLLGALLHIDADRVTETRIENSMLPGRAAGEQESILDIRVIIDGFRAVDVGLQIINEQNWPDRSLRWLCRRFASRNRAEDYSQIKPAVQIGILDFSLPRDEPEFYSTYCLANVRTSSPYSDRLQVKVLDPAHADLATDGDRRYHLDAWARLFKAKTWEELRETASLCMDFWQAAQTVACLSGDALFLAQCDARDDYYRRQRAFQRSYDELGKQLDQAQEEMREMSETMRKKDDAIREMSDTILALKDALRKSDPQSPLLKNLE